MTKVVKTTETSEAKQPAKKVTLMRDILGVKLSTKLPKETIATIATIKTFAGKVNVPFETLFSEFCKELAKISKSQSNRKTRFRRHLYRNLEGILLKNSIQSAKFNLKANIKGIVIKTKEPIIYKSNGDADINSVDNNSYSFKVLKQISTINDLAISKELLARIANLKQQ